MTITDHWTCDTHWDHYSCMTCSPNHYSIILRCSTLSVHCKTTRKSKPVTWSRSMPSMSFCDGGVEIHKVIYFSLTSANHTWHLPESVAFSATRTVMSERSWMTMYTPQSTLRTMSRSTVAFTQVTLTRSNPSETWPLLRRPIWNSVRWSMPVWSLWVMGYRRIFEFATLPCRENKSLTHYRFITKRVLDICRYDFWHTTCLVKMCSKTSTIQSKMHARHCVCTVSMFNCKKMNCLRAC